VYDSMIMIGIRNDKHEHETKLLKLNVRPRFKCTFAKGSVRPVGIKPHDIRNKTRGLSPMTHSNQSKCKTSEYKAQRHQQHKIRKTDVRQA